MRQITRKNRITALFLAILMIFSVVTGSIGVTAMNSSAATTTALGVKNWYGLPHRGGTLANGYHLDPIDHFNIMSIDGLSEAAYCLEPGVSVAGNSIYSKVNDFLGSSPAVVKNLTTARQKQELVSQLIQYGPENAYSSGQNAQYAAIQILIWEVVLEERDANFNKVAPRSGVAVKSMYYGNGYDDMNRYYNEYAEKMQNRGTIPSFASGVTFDAPTIKLNQFDGTYYYRTITDTEGVIGDYTFEADSVTFSVSGNQLTIRSRNIIEDPVLASGTYTGADVNRRGLFFWGLSGMQGICSLGDLTDPGPSAYFKVKTDVFGQIFVNKTSSDTSITNGNNYYSFEGAQYRITGPNGYNQVITTNADGEAQTERTLALGTYTVTEIKAPPGFVLDDTPQTVVISQDSPIVNAVFTERAEQPNKPQMGKIRLQKSTTPDAECEICNKVVGDQLHDMSGGVFKVYNSAGTLVDTLTTDAKGYAESKELPLGRYSIVEETPPPGYLINDDIEDAVLSPGAQTAEIVYDAVSVFEEHQHGRIRIIKNDAETGANPQGKATLNNATFQILDPDDNMRVLQTLTCAEDENFVESDLLPLGKTYVVIETDEPEGYNPTDVRYEVELDYDQSNIPVIETSVTVYNEIIRGSVELVKSKEEIVDDTKVTVPFEGVEFILTSQTTGQVYTGDTKLTDAQGIVRFSNLPYDDYTVHEVTPEGYLPLADFTVSVEEQGVVYEYPITNIQGSYELIIYKEDAETGKRIPYPNVTFQIYEDVNKNEQYDEGIDQLITWQVRQEDGSLMTYDTLSTSENGVAMLPEPLESSSKYLIKEIDAPYGYVREDGYIPCDLTKGDSDIQQVLIYHFANTAQKAQLVIYKTGEILSSVQTVDSDYGPVYIPQYTVGGLPNAVFQIIAAEDIVTPDGTVRYTKDTVVATITTGADGKAYSPLLYLGKYIVKETQAPENYVLDSTPYEVSLEYAGQEIAVITQELGFTDERQKAEIDITKLLELPDENYSGEMPSYEGIIFGLFASEDISVNGNVIIPADSLMEILPVNADGKVSTTSDIPVGTYYIQELRTNDGYILDTQKYQIEFVYQGEEISTVLIPVNNGEAIVNKLQKLNLTIIKDSPEHKNIENIPFRVTGTTLTGNAYENIVYTDAEGKISLEGLLIGQYTIEELECEQNEWYILPESQTIDLVTEDMTVEFFNQPKTGDLELLKTFEGSTEDINANLYVNEIPEEDGSTVEVEAEDTENAETTESSDAAQDTEDTPQEAVPTVPQDIEFTDEDGNIVTRYVKAGVPFHIWGTSYAGYEYDEVLYTDKDGKIVVEDLPVGEYNIEEITGEWTVGYVGAGQWTFSINHDEVTDEIVNNEKIRAPFDFTKTDISTGEVIPDCGVTIRDEAGEIVYEGYTDENGKIEIELEYGKYTYQEHDAPEGYEIDTKEYPFEIKENGVVVKAVMTDKPILTDISIIKKEHETEKVLPGAVFGIYMDGSDEALQTVTTDENGMATFTDLRYGTYEIKELKAPEGYSVNSQTIKFTIDDDKNYQKVYEFYDVPIPKTGYSDVLLIAGLIGMGTAIIGAAVLTLSNRKKKEER